MIDGADNVFSLQRKELFWQYWVGTFLPKGLNERATRCGTRHVCVWCGLNPAIESGVSGGLVWQCSAVFLFGFMFLLHVALGWNSLSSHSRFSNLRIIER